ncbi:hypothetical protein CHUAL_008896 [Chamberlinius hualienensis]
MLSRRSGCLKSLRQVTSGAKCCLSTVSSSENVNKSRLTNAEVRLKRNQLFNEELKRQASLVARVEKIQVKVVRPEEPDTVLLMNKKLSTPYHCAMHINESLCKVSAVAVVNGRPWDMHRTLPEDCELSFMHFKVADTRYANKAYWRSCCFLLGLLAEKAFKNDMFVELHSWPSPDVKSGSFVYDVDLKIDRWQPRLDELRVLSVMSWKLRPMELPFQPMDVDASVALKMFVDNRYKHAQIPKIAAASQDGNSVTLYRVDDHIDISHGPMISNTRLIGRYSVTAVFPIETDFGVLHRFQGVSLPMQSYIHHTAYSILVERAAKVNPARVPQKEKPEEFVTPLHRSTEKSGATVNTK